MPMTQTERDLDRYANEKLYTFVKDVIQSFEIAEVPKTRGLACLGAVCLRFATTAAVESGATRERWLEVCNHVFDMAQQQKKENDDDDED